MEDALIQSTIGEMHGALEALRQLGLAGRPGFAGVAATQAAAFTALEALDDNLRDVRAAAGGRAEQRAVHGLVPLLRAALAALHESADAVDGLEPLEPGSRAKADQLLAQLGANMTFIERMYDAAWRTSTRRTRRSRFNAYAEHVETLIANLKEFGACVDSLGYLELSARTVLPQILADLEANTAPRADLMAFVAQAAAEIATDESVDPLTKACAERAYALIDASWQILQHATRTGTAMADKLARRLAGESIADIRRRNM